MLQFRHLFLGGLALLLGSGLSSCVDPFEPAIISAPQSYLVVDGFINLRGVTTIRLSRTQSVATTTGPQVEAGATVAIQDEAGTTYALAEQAPGTYASTALTLSPSQRYRLHLRTTQGRDYDSELVTGKLTPAIDRLSYALGNRGVQIVVNTHDPANNTRYYRWKYEETYEFHPPNQSDIEYVNGAVQRRAENIYTCWRTLNSTTIALSSTEKLSQDVVADFPLILLPATSEKLRIRYSVLVRQYAQTQEEYAYYEKLKKNTESLGGLFDPLPTQLTGNVHCRQDGTETVVGYVGAASVAEQRIFIAAGIDLPLVNSDTGYETCGLLDTVKTQNLPITPLLLIAPIGLPPVSRYTASTPACADCRLRGTNIKPAFWP